MRTFGSRNVLGRRRLFGPRHGIIPMGSEFLIALASLFSILFILSISLSFTKASEPPIFSEILNNVADTDPGIVLLGESVDVDVDEPSITVRWSILGCGADFVLPNSPMLHGSKACGMPAMPLDFYVDGSKESLATYDPTSLPMFSDNNMYSVVQNLLQFDSDHVLDVHNARLYPFDTYLLTSYIFAVSHSDTIQDIPMEISKMHVIDLTSSFVVASMDSPLSVTIDGASIPARYVELHVARPADARLYAMLLFTLNWILSHFNFGVAILAAFRGKPRRTTVTCSDGIKFAKKGTKDVIKYIGCVLAILLVIPQLREAMPDAPGFDGVLLDSIGYFPQMALAGISAIALMLILAKRELDHISEEEMEAELHSDPTVGGRHSRGMSFFRVPRLTGNAHSRTISMRDAMLARLMKHFEEDSSKLA